MVIANAATINITKNREIIGPPSSKLGSCDMVIKNTIPKITKKNPRIAPIRDTGLLGLI
jgi:hypothetical protein